MSIVEINETRNTVEVTGENQIIVVQTSGVQGADGQGVPSGGSTGYLLAKNSGTDFDTEWINPTTVGVTDHGNLTGLADDDHTQYLNSARFDTAFAAKSTTNLSEGTNLYYTAARFNSAFSGKSTSDLTEGTNLYYTAARFNTAFAAKSTTDLTEGSNLYYTSARFDSAFSGKTTDNLTEGSTNLYFTSARAISEVASTYVAKAGDTMTGTLTIGGSTSTASLHVQTLATNRNGITIQATSGQTSNLLAILDSTANPVAGINHSGQMQATASATGYIFSGNDAIGMSGVGAVLTLRSNYTERLRVHTDGQIGINTLATPTAQLDVRSGGASRIVQIIRGVSGQSASLSEWQDNTGTALVRIDSSGRLIINNSAPSQTSGLHVRTFGATSPSMIVQNVPAQSADMVQFRDSGGTTVLAAISVTAQHQSIAGSASTPSYSFYGFSNNGLFKPSGDTLGFSTASSERMRITSSGQVSIGVTSGIAQLGIVNSAAGGVAQVIRGAASQSANLVQYQDAVGTVLSAVTSAGYFQAGGTSGVGTLKLQSDRAAILVKGSTDGGTGPFIDYDINSSSTAGLTFARISSGSLSSATSGNNVAVAVNPTFFPAAGAGNFRALEVNYTNNASGAQTGSSIGLRVNRNTSGTSFGASLDILASFETAAAQRLIVYNQGTSLTEVNTAHNGNYGIRSDGAIKGNSFYNYTTSGGWYTAAGNPIFFSNTSDNVGIGISSGIGAKLHIGGFAAATVGQIIRGAASQTANLQEWQNSAGAILVRVNSLGDLVTSSAFYTHLGLANTSSGNNSYIGVPATGPYITRNIADSSPALYIRNVNASSTGNILECRGSSNTNLFSVTVAGKMNIDTSNTATTVGASGAASALPALPLGYIIAQINGTDVKIPYYTN